MNLCPILSLLIKETSLHHILTYSLFEIDGKGVTGEIISDDVGELTAKHQRIIYQSVIEPKYIKFKGMFKVINRKGR